MLEYQLLTQNMLAIGPRCQNVNDALATGEGVLAIVSGDDGRTIITAPKEAENLLVGENENGQIEVGNNFPTAILVTWDGDCVLGTYVPEFTKNWKYPVPEYGNFAKRAAYNPKWGITPAGLAKACHH